MNKDNNNGKKNLNGKLIRESLMDYNNLAQQLNENVTESVRTLLSEQVRQAYASILNESDDEDDIEEKGYDVEEVDDTQDDANDANESGTQEDSQEETTEETTETGTESEDGEVDDEESEDVIDTEEETDEAPEDEIEDEAGFDFEKFKVSDNEYDFRNAKDDEIVAVYKRLNNDDQVTVVKDDNKVSISDKETGADYIIDLAGNDNTSQTKDENLTDDMKESVIYEIALNEYDSNVGYTDDYQKKDVMTTDGVKEPGKGRDIDNGIPKTTEKPWSNKKDAAPFNDKKGKTVECGNPAAENNAPEMDETAAQKGGTNRMMGTKSHIPNTSCTNNPKKHVASVAGVYNGGNTANEAVIRKANKIFEENKKLKSQLDKITDMLREAAVTNVNLGGIIKLISENATTKEEKRDIINRFTNEVHTIEESKSLYKTISNELNKKPHSNTNINEESQFGNSNAEVINESKFYQDESLINSLGLMHKICK